LRRRQHHQNLSARVSISPPVSGFISLVWLAGFTDAVDGQTKRRRRQLLRTFRHRMTVAEQLTVRLSRSVARLQLGPKPTGAEAVRTESIAADISVITWNDRHCTAAAELDTQQRCANQKYFGPQRLRNLRYSGSLTWTQKPSVISLI